MIYKICTEFPNQMPLSVEGPRLSLYMPTHRIKIDRRHDEIVFKNLIKKAKTSLEQKYSHKEIAPLISNLEIMENDRSLWNYAQDGLALFATLEEIVIYRLEKEMQSIVVVASSFHTKPMIEYYQGIENYTVLQLEADSFAIYEGNYYDIVPIALEADAKTTLEEILGYQSTQKHVVQGSYGGISSSSFHGHGDKTDDIDIDRAKFFKHVDRFVSENISSKAKLPLVLLANKDFHYDFKKISTNSYLIEDSLEGSIDDAKEGLKIINDQRFDLVINQAIDKYHNLIERKLSSNQIDIILKALLDARVDTLFVEKDKIIPGKIHRTTQRIVIGELNNPNIDDVLDDMAQEALNTGAKVFILDKEKMPTNLGVAAIFRY